MSRIDLVGSNLPEYTHVPDIFIDKYMPSAEGYCIQIYLFLVRSLKLQNAGLSISQIADKLNKTECDIERGLKYWENNGLLSIIRENGKIVSIKLIDIAKPAVNASDRAVLKTDEAAPALDNTFSLSKPAVEDSENVNKKPATDNPKPGSEQGIPSFEDLMEHDIHFYEMVKCFIEPTHIISSKECDLIRDMYSKLHFKSDLIIEIYNECLDELAKKNRPSRDFYSFLKKKVMDYSSNGYRTLDDKLKDNSDFKKCMKYYVDYLRVRSKSLNPTDRDYLSKWYYDWQFGPDMILLALQKCGKTSDPNPLYANKILEDWHNKGIKEPADVEKEDKVYQSEKAKQGVRESRNVKKTPDEAKKNFYNMHTQGNHSYNELVDLELRLLNK